MGIELGHNRTDAARKVGVLFVGGALVGLLIGGGVYWMDRMPLVPALMFFGITGGLLGGAAAAHFVQGARDR